MYIKRVYPLLGMLAWTRRYIFRFLIISAVPVILFDILNWNWLHLPWLPIGLLGTAVAFIAGFKNNASYDRLWEARKIWGGIVNASRSWTVMVKDFITNEFTDNPMSKEDLWKIHREFVHRHIAWLTALRHQLRKDKPWETHLKTSKENVKFRKTAYDVPEDMYTMENDIESYLSAEDQKEIFAKGNKASQLLGIQSRRLREMKHQGLLDDFRHMEMNNMVVEFYTLQGKAERIKNFPYPRQFATLNFYFVWIFILLLPFGVMNEFDSIGLQVVSDLSTHEHQAGFLHSLLHLIGDHFVWFSIPFSALISWVFFTLELIGENTENPFEGGPNDVPITNMSRGIEIDIRQLINDHDIPEPYTWRNDIIM